MSPAPLGRAVAVLPKHERDRRAERMALAVAPCRQARELEASVLTIAESQLALSALAALPSGDEEVRALLRRLLRWVKPTLLRRMS